uniref:Transposase n=1 Tax=Haemonchus contortus TaxID=6289 RepID=A0A7I4Z210_HAECO
MQFQEPSGFFGHRFPDGPGDIGPAGFTEQRFTDGPGGFDGPATGPNNLRLRHQLTAGFLAIVCLSKRSGHQLNRSLGNTRSRVMRATSQTIRFLASVAVKTFALAMLGTALPPR